MKLFFLILLLLNVSFANYDYLTVKKDISRSQYDKYFNFPDSPLKTLLKIDYLLKEFDNKSNQEIMEFVDKFYYLKGVDNLYNRLIKRSSQNDYRFFIEIYNRKYLKNFESQCIYLNNQDGKIDKKEALILYENININNSPCNDFFDKLETNLFFDNKVFLDKIENLLVANKISYAKKINMNIGNKGDYLLYALENPNSIKVNNIENNTNQIVHIVLLSLNHPSYEPNYSLIENYLSSVSFSQKQLSNIFEKILLSQAKKFDLKTLNSLKFLSLKSLNHNVSDWYLRLLVKYSKFQDILNVFRLLPSQIQKRDNWQYWMAISYKNITGKKPDKFLINLSKKRSFYGFLAADILKINLPFNEKNDKFNAKLSLEWEKKELFYVVKELDKLGYKRQADGILLHAIKYFDKTDQIAISYLSTILHKYYASIFMANKLSIYDNFKIRFPLPYYLKEIHNLSKKYFIDSELVLAVIRKESAFLDDIQSHAGAKGLMQLMPPTALEVAKSISLDISNPSYIFKIDVNIELGSAYMSKLLKLFNNNSIFSIIAYNAGPNRLRSWIESGKGLRFDSFVETIPFEETRNYVQSVLVYRSIYAKKLYSKEKPFLSQDDMRFPL